MNGSSDEEYEETQADEAKEVLDKANFVQRQQRGSFRLLLPPHLCMNWCSPAKRQGNKRTASISFSFLRTDSIGAEL